MPKMHDTRHPSTVFCCRSEKNIFDSSLAILKSKMSIFRPKISIFRCFWHIETERWLNTPGTAGGPGGRDRTLERHSQSKSYKCKSYKHKYKHEYKHKHKYKHKPLNKPFRLVTFAVVTLVKWSGFVKHIVDSEESIQNSIVSRGLNFHFSLWIPMCFAKLNLITHVFASAMLVVSRFYKVNKENMKFIIWNLMEDIEIAL